MTSSSKLLLSNSSLTFFSMPPNLSHSLRLHPIKHNAEIHRQGKKVDYQLFISKTHRTSTSQLEVSPLTHLVCRNLSFAGRPTKKASLDVNFKLPNCLCSKIKFIKLNQPFIKLSVTFVSELPTFFFD